MSPYLPWGESVSCDHGWICSGSTFLRRSINGNPLSLLQLLLSTSHAERTEIGFMEHRFAYPFSGPFLCHGKRAATAQFPQSSQEIPRVKFCSSLAAACQKQAFVVQGINPETRPIHYNGIYQDIRLARAYTSTVHRIIHIFVTNIRLHSVCMAVRCSCTDSGHAIALFSISHTLYILPRCRKSNRLIKFVSHVGRLVVSLGSPTIY